MQSQFIKTCAALGVAGIAGATYAGDTARYDVSFSDLPIQFNVLGTPPTDPSGLTSTPTGDPGRYLTSIGFSNVDADVCWNVGVQFEGWASEINFCIELDDNDVDGDGTAEAWYFVSPFVGDDTGAATEGTCVNKQALDELDVPLTPFAQKVPANGDVRTGMTSSWDQGVDAATGENYIHSTVNTANFYFILGGEIPAGCDGATGSCGEVNGTPGCEDIVCCSAVCELEPFCCEVDWDTSCVEIAVDACGIFQYSCDAPAYTNDCATSPQLLGNGETVAFDNANANTDGPDAVECGSAETDLPVWGDLWYVIEVADEATVTMSCCNAAIFDTKIAMYSAGAIGDALDPATLPDTIIGCNEDCSADAGEFFTSEYVATVPAGQYLVRVGGFLNARGSGDLTVSWNEPEPPLPAPECATPGATNISQILVDSAEFGNGGVWCGAAAENVVCRTFPASDFGGPFDVSCVDFAWFFNEVSTYMPVIINLYRADAANPLDMTVQELIATTSAGLTSGEAGTGYTISSQSFETPVSIDLADGEYLMAEVRFQRQLAGGTEYGGFCGFLLADSTAEGYISCGGAYFGSLSDIGFPDLQPYIVVNGDGGSAPSCPGDFNDDGIVDGADFGAILAAWGPCPAPCPEDMSGDGDVNGSDVGLLLAAWGNCP